MLRMELAQEAILISSLAQDVKPIIQPNLYSGLASPKSTSPSQDQNVYLETMKTYLHSQVLHLSGDISLMP